LDGELQPEAGRQHCSDDNLGRRTYDVWKTSSNQYIAFVPTAVFTSGTVDLLEILK